MNRIYMEVDQPTMAIKLKVPYFVVCCALQVHIQAFLQAAVPRIERDRHLADRRRDHCKHYVLRRLSELNGNDETPVTEAQGGGGRRVACMMLYPDQQFLFAPQILVLKFWLTTLKFCSCACKINAFSKVVDSE